MDNREPKTKTGPALSVYLGPEPDASRRLAALDSIGDQLGVNRSKLIQMLADGQFAVIVLPQDVPLRIARAEASPGVK